ncbi:MAG TPA: ion transporter [Thermoanaerobaculia bacterium]|nr:ion transporter [Thermoanaerobaculia bacterium]
MTTATLPPPERTSPFQLVMVVLSLYVVVALFMESLIKLTPATASLLQMIDSMICVVFLVDFGVRFTRAESKAKFMRWGWIDLIASIPTIDALRWGRLIRIVRILRAFRSARVFATFFLRRRAESALATVTTLGIALVIFSSLAILNLETDTQSNIRTPGDALWWSLTTITTVGYGDRYPVTAEGRVIAVLLMIAGAALFSTFTAFVATFFMEAPKQNDEMAALAEEVRALRAELERHGISSSRDAVLP